MGHQGVNALVKGERTVLNHVHNLAAKHVAKQHVYVKALPV